MAERINLSRQESDEVAASAKQSPAPPSGGRPPTSVGVLLIAIVVLVGVVTYLGPILKPFLVAVLTLWHQA